VVACAVAIRCLYSVPHLPALRTLRLRLALTQRELALRAQISQTALSDLETLKTQARPSTMRKLATALGVQPAELMEFERLDR
jgi:transcriptional regulator with XRE-family HTH domain